jgi:lysophospholipase L1-like esterase
MPDSPPRRLTWRARLALLLAGTIVSLLVLELAVRVAAPWRAFRVSPLTGRRDEERLFTTDPELGYRPVTGNEAYDEHGVRRNGYALEKRPGVRRLLFLGDSVTARGRIIEALRALAGEAGYEYWNAGVESFNTVQEVLWYERFNAAVRPDHVILTFHVNDFGSTPIAFRDAEGRLVLHATGGGGGRVLVPFLYRHSWLYRVLVSRLAGGTSWERAVNETRRSLERLRDRLARDRVALSIVVHPVMRPPAEWSRGERAAHEEALRLAAELGLRCFDLRPPLESAIAAGLSLEEEPGDAWHPSPATAAHFARWLVDQGLLER